VKAFAICLHRRAPPPLFTADAGRGPAASPPPPPAPGGLFPESSVLSGENWARSVRFLMNSELKMSPFAQPLFKKTAVGWRSCRGDVHHFCFAMCWLQEGCKWRVKRWRLFTETDCCACLRVRARFPSPSPRVGFTDLCGVGTAASTVKCPVVCARVRCLHCAASFVRRRRQLGRKRSPLRPNRCLLPLP